MLTELGILKCLIQVGLYFRERTIDNPDWIGSDFIGHVFEIYTTFYRGTNSGLFRRGREFFCRYLATSCSLVEQWRGLGRIAVVRDDR